MVVFLGNLWYVWKRHAGLSWVILTMSYTAWGAFSLPSWSRTVEESRGEVQQLGGRLTSSPLPCFLFSPSLVFSFFPSGRGMESSLAQGKEEEDPLSSPVLGHTVTLPIVWTVSLFT